MIVENNTYFKDFGWTREHQTSLDSSNTFVLFYACQSFIDDSDVMQGLKDAFPASKVIGCSTAGEIIDNQIHSGSLVYVVVKFEKTRLKLMTRNMNDDGSEFETGTKLAERIYDKDLSYVFVLTCGLENNISKLLDGLKNHLNDRCKISGGIAGDNERFEKTWIYADGFKENAVLLLGFYGDDLIVGNGCEGGWDKFGIERLITKSKENILYEVDNQPALSLYKKYLGELSEKLPSSALFYPLAIRSENENNFMVRTILSINEEDNSMTFAGDIPLNWKANLMRSTTEGLLMGAKKAGQDASKSLNGSASLAISISCVGRRLVLGQGAFHEIEAVKSTLPATCTNIGFYSYGEISPDFTLIPCLHNQTMTVTVMSEK